MLDELRAEPREKSDDWNDAALEAVLSSMGEKEEYGICTNIGGFVWWSLKACSYNASWSTCDWKSCGMRRDGDRLKPWDSLKEDACDTGRRRLGLITVEGVRGSEDAVEVFDSGDSSGTS